MECGELISGRSDKKFCSDQCRNTHNNRLNCDDDRVVRNTNRILRRNRRVLCLLNPGEKSVVSRDELLKSGFQFSYFTGAYINGNGDLYHCCYDLGILSRGEGNYTIVRCEAGCLPPELAV